MAKKHVIFSPETTSNPGFSGRDIPEDKIIQSCVRCGLCLQHCPTYLETLKETSSPRGRIHLIEAVSDGRLSVTDPGFVEQMYQCLDCRACEAVCPSGVSYGKLVEAARTQIERAIPASPQKRGVRWLVFRKLFGNMLSFRKLCKLLYIYQHSGLQWLARTSGILRLLHLQHMESLLPAIAPAFFIPADQYYETPATTSSSSFNTSQFQSIGESNIAVSVNSSRSSIVSQLSRSTRVALFTGCVMSTIFAETDRATIRVLLAHGCSVIVPSQQSCCGALTIHAGDMDSARIMARKNIAAFERSGAEYIINNAAGCGSTLKEYAYLLHEEPEYAERAAHFSSRVRDFTEFLVEHEHLSTPLQYPLKLKVTYQEPCHLVHAQRISQQPRELLQTIQGIELIEMQESSLCCGSAGIYNITRPAMSRTLQQRKIQHLMETGADVVITANPGCFLQLQSGLQSNGSTMRVMHIVDLLDQANREE